MEANASYHELEPLLHLASADCAELGHPLGLPQTMVARWSQAHEREGARCAIIHHGATRVLAILADAGIRAVPLKGYLLASQYYERKGARSFRDLDLLVERESLPALNEAFLGAGLLPQPGRPSFVPAPAYTVYSLPLEDSEVAVEIDIHIGMHWPEEYFQRTAFRPQDLWSLVSQHMVEGVPSWVMNPAHLVITTLLDVAVNHRYARLIKFRDLCEILRRVEPDWGEVEEACRRWEVRSFVGPGLLFLSQMDPRLPIPAGNLDSLLPRYALMKTWLRTLRATDLPDHRSRSFSLPNLVFFLLADTGRQRARGLLHLPGHVWKGLHGV